MHVISLTLIFATHAILRYWSGDPWAATVASAMLLFFMALVRRYGGWKTQAEAISWLKAHPRSYFLVISGTVIVAVITIIAVVGALHLDHLSLAEAASIMIEGFFFYFAACSVMVAFTESGLSTIRRWLGGNTSK